MTKQITLYFYVDDCDDATVTDKMPVHDGGCIVSDNDSRSMSICESGLKVVWY